MSKYKLDDDKPRLTIKFSEFAELLKGFIPPEFEDHVLMSGTKLFYNFDVIGNPTDYSFLYAVGLIDITFDECCFYGTFFRRCYLRNVIFNHCEFHDSAFYKCRFRFVDFVNPIIYQIDFIENTIKHTTFPSNYHIPMTCPETGSFTGWKQGYGGKIIQLEIPADAKRSSANGRKCRCSKAKVVSIVNEYGDKVEVAVSYTDPNVVYKVGETVYPDGWDPDRWNECSQGIHFFMTREEAVEYKIGIYPVKLMKPI